MFFSLTSYSQTISELEAEIKRAQLEIERSQEMLSDNKNKQQSSVTELQLVQSNIRNRRKIISSLDKQASILSSNIKENNNTINHLSSSLEAMKDDYRKSVVNGYKDLKQQNFLLFLFSSSSFYEMQMRSKYLERLARLTRSKSDQIIATQSEISDKNIQLITEQSDVKKVLGERNTEVSQLTEEETKSQSLLTSLKSQESNINAEIRKNAQQISRIQDMIRTLIEQQAKDNQTISEEDKKLDIQLSNVFIENKGKFPSPVEGVIISQFGLHSDPVQKSVKVKNNGVTMRASSTRVRSIFDGEVVKVFFFQGLNNSVMIRHGHYLSVYTNLVNLDVKAGDKVSSGERIGFLSSDTNNNNFHFELWQETTPLNPEEWVNF